MKNCRQIIRETACERMDKSLWKPALFNAVRTNVSGDSRWEERIFLRKPGVLTGGSGSKYTAIERDECGDGQGAWSCGHGLACHCQLLCACGASQAWRDGSQRGNVCRAVHLKHAASVADSQCFEMMMVFSFPVLLYLLSFSWWWLSRIWLQTEG